jgi:hypothetical protein
MNIEDDNVDLGMQFTNSEPKSINSEPTEKEIREYMLVHAENYYNSRERLRETRYGGKPPEGYSSWGLYWKTR